MKLSEPQKRALLALYKAHPWGRHMDDLLPDGSKLAKDTLCALERKRLSQTVDMWCELTAEGLALAKELEATDGQE